MSNLLGFIWRLCIVGLQNRKNCKNWVFLDHLIFRTDFGCTPGLDGPYPGQWRVGIYTKVDRAPVFQARLGPANTSPQSTGSYTVRELHDPFVRYNEMTGGQLNFRAVKV